MGFFFNSLNSQYVYMSPLCLPGVVFPEAAVEVFECPDEKPPAVDTHTSVVVEVRVQDEHRVELPTVPQSSHECWVIMQPESLAEPVNTCMTHACKPVNTITDISLDFLPLWFLKDLNRYLQQVNWVAASREVSLNTV